MQAQDSDQLRERVEKIEQQLGLNGKQSVVDEIAAKVKKASYDIDILKRQIENTTEYDRLRDEMDKLLHRTRKVEIHIEKGGNAGGGR